MEISAHVVAVVHMKDGLEVRLLEDMVCRVETLTALRTIKLTPGGNDVVAIKHEEIVAVRAVEEICITL